MKPTAIYLDWIRRQLELVDSDPTLSLAEFVWRQRCAIELYNQLYPKPRDASATSLRL